MKREFNVAEQITEIENFIKDYFVNNGTPETKAVIGISGGKDSTIAAALLVRVLGKDRVIGVLMPQDEQKDIADSFRVCEYLGIQKYVIDIGQVYNELDYAFSSNTHFIINSQIATNAPARLRMIVLYMVAAAVGGRVCNTGNASEAFIGYTTKYGDLAGDFALLKNLTVREVYAIGDFLNLPTDLVHKTPSDGMSGKSDEENMGITYEEIDNYLLDGIYPEHSKYENMMKRHERNKHKEVINLEAPTRVGKRLYYKEYFEF